MISRITETVLPVALCVELQYISSCNLDAFASKIAGSGTYRVLSNAIAPANMCYATSPLPTAAGVYTLFGRQPAAKDGGVNPTSQRRIVRKTLFRKDEIAFHALVVSTVAVLTQSGSDACSIVQAT